MAKIRFKNWKFPIDIVDIRYVDGYRINGIEWWKTTSEHGKSKGMVKCPCCKHVTQIYIWSFIGCGKRCESCNLRLGASAAFLYFKEVTDVIIIKDNTIELK